MKKTLCIIALSLCALCLFACGTKYDESYVYDGESLIGTWQEEEIDYADYYTYEFLENGKMYLKQFVYGMEISSEEGTYSVKDGKIEALFLEDNGKTSSIENKFSITQDGELVLVRLSTQNQMEEIETVYVPHTPVFNLENPIEGTWENTEVEDELWIFDKNYEITIPNEIKEEKMLYSVKDDKIYMLYLIDSGEHKLFLETPMIFDYELSGDTLKLYGEVNYTFKRK